MSRGEVQKRKFCGLDSSHITSINNPRQYTHERPAALITFAVKLFRVDHQIMPKAPKGGNGGGHCRPLAILIVRLVAVILFNAAIVRSNTAVVLPTTTTAIFRLIIPV